MPVVPAAPVTAPAAVQAGERPEPCRFLSQNTVADLAGDQRTQIVGSGNTCSFTIGGNFSYQINVQPNDNGRFESERDRLFKNSVPVAGVGDEAFYRDGTSITVLGARKGDTYFAVTLVPTVSDPAGAGGTPPPAAGGQNQNQNRNQVGRAQAALAAGADVDADGVVDADQDGDGQVDDDADADAVAATDADGDGAVDDDVAAAVQAVADAADADDAGGAAGAVGDLRAR
ncbi:hypothetical protein, partial [Pseudonocardia lacus]|uniref:hypothetical protein n=1 Tax=Pseudonocardia lacus TaxID=2835865 RepID=UPI001BDBE973